MTYPAWLATRLWQLGRSLRADRSAWGRRAGVRSRREREQRERWARVLERWNP